MDDAGPANRIAGRPAVFWPTVWLAGALVGIKATYVTLTVSWDWATPLDYASWLFVRWVAAAAQADLLFALSCGVAAALTLRALARRAQAGRLFERAFLLFGSLSILYAVVSRQVFAYYGAPLTYQLLALGGEPSRLASSIEPYVTGPVVLALVGAPAGYVLLSWLAQGRAPTVSGRGPRVMKLVACVALLAWTLLGRGLLGTAWFTSQDRYVADSPHWTLLRSVGLGMSSMQSKLLSGEVHPEDLRDFEPVVDPVPIVGHASKGIDAGRPRPRNVVLIVLESVGTRHLNLYGSKFDTTPRLVSERGRSLVFDAYYAPVGWTAYSLAALVVSRRPPMDRYNTTSFRVRALEGESLATVLQSRGYRTAFMSAGDPDWASEGFFQGKGFETVRNAKHFVGAEQISSWGIRDSVLFDHMIEWIDRHQREPFFLMAWTEQTHHPYELAPGQAELQPLPPGVKGGLVRYLTLVREADAQIGRVFDALRERNLAEETLVVATGDHGEAFHDVHGTSGHGFSVYDEEVRVPLVLWNPRLFRGENRSSVVGSHVDLPATLVDVLGIPAPGGWDGRSLLDPSRPPRTYLFAAAWGQYLLGVRENNWKYIADLREGREELYDLAADPEEQRDVAGLYPERSRRFRERLAAWLQAERKRGR